MNTSHIFKLLNKPQTPSRTRGLINPTNTSKKTKHLSQCSVWPWQWERGAIWCVWQGLQTEGFSKRLVCLQAENMLLPSKPQQHEGFCVSLKINNQTQTQNIHTDVGGHRAFWRTHITLSLCFQREAESRDGVKAEDRQTWSGKWGRRAGEAGSSCVEGHDLCYLTAPH